MYQDLDILCVGGLVCDFMIKPVPTDFFDHEVGFIETIETNVGGDAANEAVIMAKLGMKVGLATEVGGDSTGQEMLDYMKKFGVDTSNVVVREGKKTRTNIVAIRADGERHFLVFPMTFDEYGKEDLDYEMLKHTKMVSIGSIHMYTGLDLALVDYLKAAKEAGCITSADMVSNQTKMPLSFLKECCQYLDYFVPSEGEVEEIFGEKIDPKKAAEEFLSWGAKNVVIKLGSKGCFVKNAREEFMVPSFKVDAIDTTGAGDNFTAGFLTAVMKGWDLKKCATFAAAVGSIAVQSIGANTGVKNIEQVMEVMNSRTE